MIRFWSYHTSHSVKHLRLTNYIQVVGCFWASRRMKSLVILSCVLLYISSVQVFYIFFFFKNDKRSSSKLLTWDHGKAILRVGFEFRFSALIFCTANHFWIFPIEKGFYLLLFMVNKKKQSRKQHGVFKLIKFSHIHS